MIIVAILAAQAVPTTPTTENIATATTRRSFELPKVVESAIWPYFSCVSAGSNGVTVTSAAQARAISAENKERCTSSRAQSKNAAIELLKEKSRISESDRGLFIEAILGTVDNFLDPAIEWRD